MCLIYINWDLFWRVRAGCFLQNGAVATVHRGWQAEKDALEYM